MVALTPVWSGDPAEGERFLAEVAALGKPIVDQVRPMQFQETFVPADARAAVPHGLRCAPDRWRS